MKAKRKYSSMNTTHARKCIQRSHLPRTQLTGLPIGRNSGVSQNVGNTVLWLALAVILYNYRLPVGSFC